MTFSELDREAAIAVAAGNVRRAAVTRGPFTCVSRCLRRRSCSRVSCLQLRSGQGDARFHRPACLLRVLGLDLCRRGARRLQPVAPAYAGTTRRFSWARGCRILRWRQPRPRVCAHRSGCNFRMSSTHACVQMVIFRRPIIPQLLFVFRFSFFVLRFSLLAFSHRTASPTPKHSSSPSISTITSIG